MARLLAWGPAGIGGFAEHGHDADGGVWLERPGSSGRLDTWLRQGPHPWAEVRPLVLSLLSRLEWCEEHSLNAGPLRSHEVGIDIEAGTVVLRAESLVRGLAGAPTTSATGSPGMSRYVPPAQARGEPWDAAASRYVAALWMYRALAGHHPFSGKGLRRGLEEQADRGAPPFDEAVAMALPPGVQSLCLQMLDPDPRQRPPSAASVLAKLRGLTEIAAAPPAATPSAVAVHRVKTVPAVAPRPSASPAPRQGRTWRRIMLGLPIVGGLGLAAALGSVVEPPPAVASPTVGAARPLTLEQTKADDCAACHPRQVAQWTQSVMAHSIRSPLFQGLEILIQEQVGRDFDCPEGAGALRTADPRTACRNPDNGLPITGSGGELWCVNCHGAAENLRAGLPAWDGRSRDASSRQPLGDLLPAATMEGITCAVCHTAHGPVQPGNELRGDYEGNPSWVSFITGQRFFARPEDAQGTPGIANSGYHLDPSTLLVGAGRRGTTVPGGAHLRPSAQTRDYLKSSEFCGACHDVRLFGTDVVGVRQRGEHFKRLRNAYSEWRTWADDERRSGRQPASCQDCHMSEYPGLCVDDEQGLGGAFVDPGATALRRACPPGTHFEARAPGQYPRGRAAIASGQDTTVTSHYFSGVDAPLTNGLSEELLDDPRLDELGLPRGLRPRRDLLLGRTFRFEVNGAGRRGATLEVPIELENVGAGHRVPAGFSQEREIWVHLRVTDARGRVLYEVGRVDRGDQDLADKRFLRINVDDRFVDDKGRPLGMFGADITDGPDVPQWNPPPLSGATRFTGQGLINLQNGFLRCVKCIGEIDVFGRCQAGPGQGRTRADRFDDGVYDLDTGECISNLAGEQALFETYFPVGGLDSTRGVTKAPDAIIDTRSAPPGVPLRYTYALPVGRGTGPISIEARLMFRAFPPFLVRAFADYEALQAARGNRRRGPLVTHEMLERLEVVELHRVQVEIP